MGTVRHTFFHFERNIHENVSGISNFGDTVRIYWGHEREKKEKLKSRKSLYLHTWKHERETNHVRYAPTVDTRWILLLWGFKRERAFDSRLTFYWKTMYRKKNIIKNNKVISSQTMMGLQFEIINQANLPSFHFCAHPLNIQREKMKKVSLIFFFLLSICFIEFFTCRAHIFDTNKLSSSSGMKKFLREN